MEWSTIVFVVAAVLLIALVYNIAMRGRRGKKKAAVFDLDETLGSFTQLGILKDLIERYNGFEMSQNQFNRVIDMNPEFVRPGIVDILKFVVAKRDRGQCDAIMIYTNNNGSRSWSESIAKYFDHKVGKRVFDQIICAYKVNGRRVEPGRTTHDKTYADFLRCSEMPGDTQVCFYDDVFHPQMEHDNVVYINAKGYTNVIPLETSVRRIYENDPALQNAVLAYAEHVYGHDIKRGEHRSAEEHAVDVVIGKRMLDHTKEFFGGGSSSGRRTQPPLYASTCKSRKRVRSEAP